MPASDHVQAVFNKDGTLKEAAAGRLKEWERMRIREELTDELLAAKEHPEDQDRLTAASKAVDAWRTMERAQRPEPQAGDGVASPEPIRAKSRANTPGRS
jgi:hypothetical protein